MGEPTLLAHMDGRRPHVETSKVDAVRIRPPDHSRRLLPSTPTRLADGLGPKRLPYAFLAIRPKYLGPPFLPNAGLSD